LSESRLINRNVTAARGRTSMRLEPELWSALEEICQREGLTLAEAVRKIELSNPHSKDGGRTSAVRVFIVSYFRAAATALSHQSAGHGPLP
jgi:predicted DNA-binding ribbon-helix-helix protein